MELSKESFVFRLYVSGETQLSATAVANFKTICESALSGKYRLDIIDVFQRPDLAEEERILVTPTLIKELPAPLRRVIGDLSDHKKTLGALNINATGGTLS